MNPSILVANGPVSFGAFELTVGRDPNVPAPEQVLDAMRDGGYAGTDLGPPGYLGTAADLPERLRARSLGLSGAFVEFPFVGQGDLAPALAELDRVLDVFDAVTSRGGGMAAPRPTIADLGTPARRANPARAQRDASLRLDATGWRALADRVAVVVERSRRRGYEPAFHPELGVGIEAPVEIERLLDLTDVGLCLDSGHFFLAGGDPVRAVRDWASRINHVHVKDGHRRIVDQVVAERAPVEEVYRRGAFCALGEGDVDLDGFFAALKATGYAGWLVVESDRVPDPAVPVAAIAAAEKRNRDFLRARGLG